MVTPPCGYIFLPVKLILVQFMNINRLLYCYIERYFLIVLFTQMAFIE